MKDTLLLVSHGTVDELDDLAAFVTNVRRGHAPSAEVVAELRRRYEAIGGQSPLNAINAQLADKLAVRLGVRVAWANRLWKPTVREVLTRLASEGVRRVAVLPLAQHSARVYADDAREAAEGTGIELTCAPDWGQSPALCEAFAGRVLYELSGGADLAHTTVVMTAHSLPLAAIAAGDAYEAELRAAAERVAAIVRKRLGHDVRCVVAFQSQGMSAGPGGKPVEWLGPDLKTTLDEAAARGDKRVVLAPIGFLADHVEILYDLDIEAAAMAKERGLRFARAHSLNASDDLVHVLADVARPLLGQG
ncbi:MAG TPA: ferrochelatase [Polyangiaceae bacterium]|jgi:ferrochelatase